MVGGDSRNERLARLIEQENAAATAAKAWENFEAAAMLNEVHDTARGRPGQTTAIAALAKLAASKTRRAEKQIFQSEWYYALAAHVRLHGMPKEDDSQ